MPALKQNRITNCLYLLFAVSLSTQVLSAETKVLKNFTLIDGAGQAPLARAAMIIDNGRIRWVGPVAQLKAPASAETIDLTGKYVMPGLINLHGHVGNTVDLQQSAKFFTRDNIQKNLRTYASYGVTTVLSMGTDQDLMFKIRAEQRATGRPSEARVYTAGQGFIFKGGYGGLAGVNTGVSSVAEVEPAVAAQAAKHVDIIKLWLDDHLGTQKKMPYPIAKAIIESAHRHNLRVAAHIFYLQDAKELVSYGVDGLAHSVRDKPIDQALIDGMKQHGAWQMAATLTREASMFVYGETPSFANDPFFTRALSAQVLQTLKSPKYQQTVRADPDFRQYRGLFETARRNLKTLASAGVSYGMGTDTGPPGRFPGYFEQWELELMVQSGLTPMQAITAATRSGAEFLHANDLGTLQASKWADLVVLRRNPLDDIKNTRSIEAVYIAGNRITESQAGSGTK
ncbi:MAG TPA: amidohydrolase family protein [Bryobacteraceae bacterium]|nr:amidohydrolase family protein [Bryobacteraceae bacterium]